MTILFCTFVLLLAVCPALWNWWSARRERRIAEARLGITEAVTQFNQLMLEGVVPDGGVMRDELYRMMHVTQSLPVLPLRIFNRTPIDAKDLEFKKALFEELCKCTPAVFAVLEQFIRSFYRGARYSHPFKAAVLLSCLRLRLLFVNTGWQSLLAAARSFHFIRHLSVMWREGRKQIQREILFIGYREVITSGESRCNDALLADMRIAA